ncbi:SCAN domain-containing protein 3 [Trichonephila clavipes]|nr:SCAN domain-containing protein 3 [Trichonephila clavipes]
MKPGRVEFYLKSKHGAYVNSDLNYFESLNETFAKRSTIKSLFNTQTFSINLTLKASHEISLLISKYVKNHTIGEDLIKPSISAFLKTVLEKDDNAVKAMSLNSNTVSRRIYEMGDDIETQLVEKLKPRYFSLQMDEST